MEMKSFIASAKQTAGHNRFARAILTKRRNLRTLLKLFARKEFGSSDSWLIPLNFEKQVSYLLQSKEFLEQTLPAILKKIEENRTVTSNQPLDEDELRWIVDALGDPRDKLEIFNAKSYEEVALILLASEKGLCNRYLPPEQNAQIQSAIQGYIDRRNETEHRLATYLPSVQETTALFRLFLGRVPYSSDNIERRAEVGAQRLIESLLLSSEFRKNFLHWVETSVPIHDSHDQLSLIECKRILSDQILPILAGDLNLLNAHDWNSFLGQFWLTPEVSDDILSLFTKQDSFSEFVQEMLSAYQNSAQRTERVKPILAHANKQFISLSFQNAYKSRSPKATVMMGEDQIAEFTIPPGRHRELIQLDRENGGVRKATNHGHLNVHIGSNRYPVSIFTQPVAEGEISEIESKLLWAWRTGKFEKCRTMLDNYGHALDPAMQYFGEIGLRRTTQNDDALQDWLKFEPDWQTFNARYHNIDIDEIDFEVLATDLILLAAESPFIADWISSMEHGELVEFLSLLFSLDGIAESVPKSQSKGRAKYALSDLLRGALILSAVLDLSDDELQKIAKQILYLKPKEFVSEVDDLQHDYAVFGLIFVSPWLPIDLIENKGVSTGAANYCERVGATSHALKLVESIIKNHSKDDAANLVWAGTLNQKYGDPVIANEHFRKALEKQRSNKKLLERYLDSEKRLIVANPLRHSKDFEKKASQFRRRMAQGLLDEPQSAKAKSDVIKSLILNDDVEQARNFLNEIWRKGDASTENKIQLLDLNVKANLNKAAVEVFDSIEGEVQSEWAIINKARALRALDQPEQAGEHLEHYTTSDRKNVAREAIRNEFFLARFEQAAARGQELLKSNSDDIELIIITAAALLEIDAPERANALIEKANTLPSAARFSDELNLFEYSIARRLKEDDSIQRLNPIFLRMGCHTIQVKSSTSGGFDDFEIGRAPSESNPDLVSYPPIQNGPLVSVLMTSYNSEKYIETAIRSILEQTYSNIELIVSDDASTDATPEVLKRLENEDQRVKVILNTQNSGTYIAKNRALLSASGKYVAFQDSDDWSHPDRIAKSISVLEARRDIVGLTTDWLRMTNDGSLMVKAGGQISHVCCISLVVRRQEALDAIGFFDSVRIEADMEYIRRLQLVFGKAAVARLRWPLLFGRARSDSLTGNEEYGISRTGFSEPRLQYQAAQADWHNKIKRGESAYLPFPMHRRAFDAPAIILPEKKEAKR